MLGLGAAELLIVFAVLLFGSTRLPKLPKAMGQSARELREAARSGDDG